MLDGNGQLRVMPADRAGHMLMLSMCGGAHQEWAFYHYARWRKVAGELERIPRSIQPEHIGQDAMMLAAQRGVFDHAERVRQQGAWFGIDGDLVLHCGDHLWIRGSRCPTGIRGQYVYPVMAPYPPPADAPVGREVAQAVLDDIARWQFDRAIAPQLLLGALGLGMLAGALQHRPHVLLLGEHGMGKSGLLELLKHYLADRMLLTSDATPAGITQRVNHRALVIGLDEKEGHADPKRDLALLALLRMCYTGGESHRGGQDHKGVSFTMRCSVVAAAINPPTLEAADRSRIVLINVVGPPKGGPATEHTLRLAYDARREAVGAQLLRRLADGWKRLQLDVLPVWHELLLGVGFDGRGADTVGTLLAIAWVMLEDDAPTQSDVDWIANDLHALLRDERAERSRSYESFLSHVFGLSIDPMRKGEWRTVLEMLKQAGGYGVTADAERRVESDAMRYAATDDAAIDAARQLSRLGLRIVKDDATGERYLVVAHQSPVLAEMLRGTQWAGLPGRASPWARLLGRAPGAVSTDYPVRFASGTSRATQLPLGWVLRGVVGPDPEAEQVRWDAWASDTTKAAAND